MVNDDSEMYAEIESIPNEDADRLSKIIGLLQHHVSEVCSPPLVTKLAAEYGLNPGFALDLQVDDGNGQPWDFDKAEQREKSLRMIQDQEPQFVIGSPMCTAFGRRASRTCGSR